VLRFEGLLRHAGTDVMDQPLPIELDAAADALRSAERVVVFTGSGVSAESGIATFRDGDGLWERHDLERYSTRAALLRTALSRPAELVRFLHDVVEPIASAEPNAAHRAIAELERHAHATVVTQNVDGLHQDAGSHGVRQLHGSMLEVANGHGQVIRRLSRAQLKSISAGLQRASTGRLSLPRALRALRPLLGLSLEGLCRPNVVLFGEMLRQPDWEDALRGAELCDVMVIVGTSGMVMPAAELPLRARMTGATTVLVDPHGDVGADMHLCGRAGDIMPELVRRAFG
jgi:NAD-dependent deacetylase